METKYSNSVLKVTSTTGQQIFIPCEGCCANWWNKNCLVNSLFHSPSTCWNVGRPIRLHCVSDTIHGNNGDQESWVIEAVCKTLGYTGLKPDHKKAVRSFVNSWEVFKSLKTGSERLNASKIAKEKLLSPTEVFLSRIFCLWWLKHPKETIFETNVSGWCYCLPQ